LINPPPDWRIDGTMMIGGPLILFFIASGIWEVEDIAGGTVEMEDCE